MNFPPLTAERLRQILRYDPETGIFTWRVAVSRKVRVGVIAGRLNQQGYHQIRIDRRSYLGHRLAWLYVHGSWPANHIDHINGVVAENRITNLRNATHGENMRNCRMPKRNTSGVCGVTWVKRARRWRAVIGVNGRQKFLGDFLEKADAVAVRKAAERKYGYSERHGVPPEEKCA